MRRRWVMTGLAALLLASAAPVPAASGDQGGVTPMPAASAGITGPTRAPLDGRVVVMRGFEPPATRYGAGHRGVDLAAWPGEPVRAVASGVVAFAGSVAGRGVVSVSHGNGAVRSTYEPVRPLVTVGQRVVIGQLLGTVAPAGHCATDPPCLHLGLREGDQYLDPLRLWRRPPARLLPLHANANAT